MLGIGGFGHHFPGFIRAYSDPILFKQFKARFIFAPLFLVLFCGVFAYYNLNAITLALVLWGAWHGAMQVNGFLRIYDTKVKSVSATTAKLDWLMCLAWFGLGIWHSPVKEFALFTHFYMSGGPLISPNIYGLFKWIWDVGTGIISLLFFINVLVEFKKGIQPNPLKILSMIIAFSFWWMCMVSLNNLILGVVLFEIFHDIQYNAIVWMFQSKRVASGNSVSTIEKWFFSPGFFRLGFYLLVIAAYGYIGVITSYADINLPEKMLMGGTGSPWILRVLSVSAFLHFYYDGFIWRMRNSNTRVGLGLETNSTKSSAPFLPSHQWRHGFLWAFFIISISILGYSEYKYGTPEPQKMFINLTENIPSSWLAQFLTGTYYKIEHDSKTAADHFKMAALNNPNFDMAHMLWADMLYKNGEVKEAIEQYQITVKLEPSNNEARNNLGYLYLQTEQPVLAESEFKKAMELDNQSVDLVFGLAVALFNQKKYVEAETYLHQTLQLSPNHPQAQKFLDQIPVYLR